MEVRLIDPDVDSAIVQKLLRELLEFVAKGPYLQEGQNVCWFCFTGIDDANENQADVGHDPSCEYLTAWLMVSYGGKLVKGKLAN